MFKLIILFVTIGLSIFVRSEWIYASVLLSLIFLFSWIIKSNKQRPGESDEDYAKRMERLKEEMKSDTDLPKYESPDLVKDFKYSYLPCNIFYTKK